MHIRVAGFPSGFKDGMSYSLNLAFCSSDIRDVLNHFVLWYTRLVNGHFQTFPKLYKRGIIFCAVDLIDYSLSRSPRIVLAGRPKQVNR